MSACMALSGVLLALGCLFAIKGRTTGLAESEQQAGKWVVVLAFVVMAFGMATGN